jgi:ubiquinone/menaquinone biosynthesis C-methylase UbiE
MTEAATQSLEDYFRLMNLNGASHVYRAARQAGIFAALSKNAGPASRIAADCSLAESPTKLVLETLRTLGLVSLEQSVYALTPLARLLLAGSYQNLSDEYWNHLPHFLKTGEPFKTMDDIVQSEEHYQSQAAAMAWMFGPASESVVRLLGIGGERTNLNILDVGAGSAIWSLAIASRDVGTRVTAVDWPAVLAVAKGLAQQRQLESRLTLLPGNFHEIEYPPEAFDLAILANVTHLLSAEANRTLFQRIRKSLQPAGELLVIDVFPNDAGASGIDRTADGFGISAAPPRRSARAAARDRNAAVPEIIRIP